MITIAILFIIVVVFGAVGIGLSIEAATRGDSIVFTRDKKTVMKRIL